MQYIVNSIIKEDNYIQSFLDKYTTVDSLCNDMIKERLDKSFSNYVKDLEFSLKILAQCTIDDLMRLYKW